MLHLHLSVMNWVNHLESAVFQINFAAFSSAKESEIFRFNKRAN